MKRFSFCILLILVARVSISQNVGIGTTLPEYSLHLKKITGESSLGINAAGTASQALLNLSIDNRIDGNSLFLVKYRPGFAGTAAGIAKSNLSWIGADVLGGPLLISTNQSSHIHFATNSTERMRITSTGQVGINTTNPLTGWLHVETTDLTPAIYASSGTFTGTAFAIESQIKGNIGAAVLGTTAPGGVYSAFTSATYGVVGSTGASGYGVGAYAAAGGTALKAAILTGVGTAIFSQGNLQFTGIGEAANRVLTTDASGNATWQSLPVGASSWGVNGTHIYSNNTGNVGIKTTTPSALLTINNASGVDAFQINHPGGLGRITKIDANRQLYHEGDLWVHSAYGLIRLGYSNQGWFFGTTNGGQDLQLFSHSTSDLSTSRVNRMYIDGITGNIGINIGYNPAVYGKLIVDRNNDMNGALTGYFGSVTGLNSSATDGSGVYGISYAPRTGAQSYAGVSGSNQSTGTDRFGVIGSSNGTTVGSVYSAGVGGYGDYGVLGYSQSTTGAGMIAQHSSGKTALEVNNGFIKVSGTNKTAFKHTTALTNIVNNWSDITYDSPGINDIVIVTHNYTPNGTYLNKTYGVFWNLNTNKWAVYLEDISAMPINITFNVIVIKQ